jgi:hypothetical protein
MCPTNPQKDLKSRKGNEPFSGAASEMEFLGSIGARNGSSELTPHALQFTAVNLRYALCALLYALRKWRRIGWKNICKLWLEERSPEQLKGEGE